MYKMSDTMWVVQNAYSDASVIMFGTRCDGDSWSPSKDWSSSHLALTDSSRGSSQLIRV
jgi:hypothetical protein